MKFQHYLCFANEQWDLAMSESEHFSLEKSTESEKTAFWDQLSLSYDFGIGSDSRRIDMAMERLEKLGAFRSDTIALDIGSGTGAYTLALAERCRAVYALDSSSGMQQVLAEKAAKRGIKNIIPVCADWRAIPESELSGAFDIVLSSLNTGISDYDSLVKMNSVSRGFCCYAAPHGKAIHSTRSDLQRIVFERELRAAGGNDIIHAFNIIYGLGYQPELTYAPSEWSREQAPDEALEAICRDFGRYGYVDNLLKSKLQEYIMSHLNEYGKFAQSQKSTVGIMIWNTRNLMD